MDKQKAFKAEITEIKGIKITNDLFGNGKAEIKVATLLLAPEFELRIKPHKKLGEYVVRIYNTWVKPERYVGTLYPGKEG